MRTVAARHDPVSKDVAKVLNAKSVDAPDSSVNRAQGYVRVPTGPASSRSPCPRPVWRHRDGIQPTQVSAVKQKADKGIEDLESQLAALRTAIRVHSQVATMPEFLRDAIVWCAEQIHRAGGRHALSA